MLRKAAIDRGSILHYLIDNSFFKKAYLEGRGGEVLMRLLPEAKNIELPEAHNMQLPLNSAHERCVRRSMVAVTKLHIPDACLKLRKSR